MDLKKSRSLKLRLCAIIDKSFPSQQVINKNKITCIQVREKNRSAEALIKKIKTIKRDIHKIPIIVNDRIDVALAAKTDGLHIGRADMNIALARKMLGNRYIIGKTVRSEKQAEIAEREGADYVSIGPVFKTPLKKYLRPKGLSVLKRIKNAISIPVIAIGGINFSNIDKVKATGVDGVAMMRGLKK